MKNKDLTVSVILVIEGAQDDAIDKTLKDIFNQTWRNIEVVVSCNNIDLFLQ